MRLLCTLLLICSACGSSTAHRQQSVAVPRVEPTPPMLRPAPQTPTQTDDPYLAIPALLAMINRTRAERGAAPLRLDRALCAVAQRGAAAFVQHGGRGAEQRTAVGIADELDRFRRIYVRVATVVFATKGLSPEVAPSLQPALDPEMLSCGIAVEPLREEQAIVLILGQ